MTNGRSSDPCDQRMMSNEVEQGGRGSESECHICESNICESESHTLIGRYSMEVNVHWSSNFLMKCLLYSVKVIHCIEEVKAI